MKMNEWAKNEVKIACEREKRMCAEDNHPEDANYGIACYKSALKAFNSLCKDNHSGFSIGITRAILDALIDGKPLTPIEDTPEVWGPPEDWRDGCLMYQCKRMSRLFKKVDAEGNISYDDVDRVTYVDINNPTVAWHNGMVRRLVDEMFPITMPYTGDEKYIVYGEDCLFDRTHGDYDTQAFHYIIKKTPGGKEEKIKLNRYFRESLEGEKEDPEYPGWVEISRTTYNRRKKKAEEERKKLEEERQKAEEERKILGVDLSSVNDCSPAEE